MKNSAARPVFRREKAPFTFPALALPRITALLCCLFATLWQPILAQQPASGPKQTPIEHPTPAPHDSIQLLTSGKPVSLRGLSVVTDQIVWVSGSKGTVGKSLDGGKTWTWMTVPGYEKRDFRDVEGFDKKTAVIMAIDTPADILKTADGGTSWKLVYENKTAGMFLDAMEFWNVNSGIVVGDPINGRFFVARSFDGGDNWHDIPLPELPKADTGEGCFASSGTNVRNLDRDEACFVSGGPHSRLFIRDKAIDLPIIQGTTSTGANSVAVKDHYTLHGGQHLIVVGGDFTNDTLQEKNCFLTTDGGKTWVRPTTPPHGYRSCVEFIGGSGVMSCGLTGVDISDDDGMTWHLISTTSFHACRRAKKGKAVYLSGGNGRIAKLVPLK